jgi:hypothetical protein
MAQDKRDWEEEYKKCVSSPYYFHINFVGIKEADGTIINATTKMTEEEFNRAYSGMKEEDLILGKKRRRI